MTVEQPARPRYEQTKSGEDHTYAQVKEITGISDRHIIHEAIDACKNKDGQYEVAQVVNMLIADDLKSPKSASKKMAITHPKDRTDAVDAVSGPAANLNANKNSKGSWVLQNSTDSVVFERVIDLTNVSDVNETDDIQKAIAASLKDSGSAPVQESAVGILGGQVSREEQDISRVLEQSLIESKAGTKRKRGDIWFVDPLNPHERKRQENWPIGLKNVGNTCWFSAVIQSLFHLRRFRHLVLTYQPNRDLSQGTTEEKRNLRFMQELRHLFALMVGSKRKYVDPSKAVDILKEAFSSSVVSNANVSDSQQDVSEFQHKLLEWLEDAFKSASRPSSPAEGSGSSSSSLKSCSNPMVELFYGQFRADGMNEGKGFSNEENFGQFPLQVNGFRDIHESLEAATALREIETVSSESTQKSGQELWFTRLPPVLTFELSRFQFNQHLGRPEKIHNKIEFPPIIYMDRYMDLNRPETRLRRERSKKLKEELALLQSRLDKFTNYGSGVKRFPLQDVLIYALEFAKSRRDAPRRHASATQDVEMECPSPNTSMLVDSPVKSPCDIAMATLTSPTQQMNSPDVTTKSPVLTSPAVSIPDVTMSPAPLSNTPPDVPMPPASRSSPPTAAMATGSKALPGLGTGAPSPRHVSEGELQVLQNCLHRWRTEVESDVRELQDNIGSLEESISKMYTDDSMMKHPYHLHAVLVHEGQAASGHYWAYIYDTERSVWMKFNDITASEASWDELEKESIGGYHNASAYCLMYIDKTQVAVDSGTDLENLPGDLKDVVMVDNKLFNEEIEKWDAEAARKAKGGGDAAEVHVVEDSPAVSGSTSCHTTSTQTNVTRKTTLSELHVRISRLESLDALHRGLDSDLFEKQGPEKVLNQVLKDELCRLREIVSHIPELAPLQDPRLQHMCIYMLHCTCSDSVLFLILLEQFTEFVAPNDRMKAVMTRASLLVKEQRNIGGEALEKEYNFWHETFEIYRRAVNMFVEGVARYAQERYVPALPYLLHSYLLSEQLFKKNDRAGLVDRKLATFFLRKNLLHINDAITQKFSSASSDVGELLSDMSKLVLPCFSTMLQTGYDEDSSTVEVIREKWFNFLGQEMEDKKIEKLQDFLSNLLDAPSDLPLPATPHVHTATNLTSLHNLYITEMARAHNSGCMEGAMKGT